jgi:hypothetical protein
VKKPLGEGVLTGLEFCAHELSKHHEEDEIGPEELARLKSEFSELVKSVSGADIASELKIVLLDLLTSAIIAIDNYKILGNDGLKKAVAYSVGTLMLHQKEFLGAKEDRIVKRVVTVINSLCSRISYEGVGR